MPRTILILTAHTGGGHDSVATAVCQALAARHVAGPRVRIAAPLGSIVDRAYCWALNRAPALWGACYQATNADGAASIGTALLGACRGRSLARIIADEQPDLILSVHALCARLASSALNRLRLHIPHHCIITDLVDIHRTWIAPGVSSYYVPTIQAHLCLHWRGIPAERLVLSGLPVRRPFWPGSPLPAPTSGGDPALRRLLVMDGGQPGPALSRVARTILASGLPLSIRLAWGCTVPDSRRLSAPGCRIDHLPAAASIVEEMTWADLVVTKAGSVTIAEALAIGRPILVHRVVPGQEIGNPAFLEAARAGHAALTPADLVAQIRRLAAAPGELAAMAQHARAMGKPSAALRVADHLLAALDGQAVQEEAG